MTSAFQTSTTGSTAINCQRPCPIDARQGTFLARTPFSSAIIRASSAPDQATAPGAAANVTPAGSDRPASTDRTGPSGPAWVRRGRRRARQMPARDAPAPTGQRRHSAPNDQAASAPTNSTRRSSTLPSAAARGTCPRLQATTAAGSAPEPLVPPAAPGGPLPLRRHGPACRSPGRSDGLADPPPRTGEFTPARLPAGDVGPAPRRPRGQHRQDLLALVLGQSTPDSVGFVHP
jgi:hypothetical protein